MSRQATEIDRNATPGPRPQVYMRLGTIQDDVTPIAESPGWREIKRRRDVTVARSGDLDKVGGTEAGRSAEDGTALVDRIRIDLRASRFRVSDVGPCVRCKIENPGLEGHATSLVSRSDVIIVHRGKV